MLELKRQYRSAPHRTSLGGCRSDAFETKPVQASPRIVVVDDQPRILSSLSELLREWGFQVFPFDDGLQALEFLAEHPEVNLLITDWVMPETDGITLTRAARKLRRENPLHIMMLTSKTEVPDKVEGLTAGADCFLAKPVDPLELRAQLGVISGKIELEQRLSERLAALADARRELMSRNRELKTASEARQNFFAQMSHELRTPMQGVLSTLELLKGTGLEPQQSALVEMAEASSRSLLRILNDILDYSKGSLGEVQVEAVSFNLSQTVHESLAPLFQEAISQGLSMECLIDPSVPEAVIGDPGRLTQILVNLVGNALKFTDEGKIGVFMTSSSEDEIEIRVVDTGIGIPESKLESVFEPFLQADESIERHFGGTGLGLAICRQLSRRMGGELHLESRDGAGTVATVTLRLPRDKQGRSLVRWESFQGVKFLAPGLPEIEQLLVARGLVNTSSHPDIVFGGRDLHEQYPQSDWVGLGQGDEWAGALTFLVPPYLDFNLRRALDLRASAGAHESAEGLSKTARILLADDNPINRRVMKSALEKSGFSVRVAADGGEALTALGEEEFEVVLMDLQMPRMDGLEATRRWRDQEQSLGRDRVPIVALTAHAVQDTEGRCRQAGMDEILSKPVATADIVAKIKQVREERL